MSANEVPTSAADALVEEWPAKAGAMSADCLHGNHLDKLALVVAPAPVLARCEFLALVAGQHGRLALGSVGVTTILTPARYLYAWRK